MDEVTGPDALLPVLYLRGISTGEALAAVLGQNARTCHLRQFPG
jgi:hypothetical protein